MMVPRGKKAELITRSLTVYEVEAIGLDADGNVYTIACAHVQAGRMDKNIARAALADETGCKMPRGCIVKWRELARVKYAMPIDEFIASACIMETVDLTKGE